MDFESDVIAVVGLIAFGYGFATRLQALRAGADLSDSSTPVSPREKNVRSVLLVLVFAALACLAMVKCWERVEYHVAFHQLRNLDASDIESVQIGEKLAKEPEEVAALVEGLKTAPADHIAAHGYSGRAYSEPTQSITITWRNGTVRTWWLGTAYSSLYLAGRISWLQRWEYSLLDMPGYDRVLDRYHLVHPSLH